jgi:hypothetical protein
MQSRKLTLRFPRVGIAAATVASLTAMLLAAAPASAQIVYQNNFETNTNGFSSNSTISRPTTGAGLGSSPQSTYLGRFTNDNITLNLTGLSVGATYNVAFDLFIEATMDGNEVWSLTSSSSGTLVSTTFTNFFTQAYTDTSFTSPVPATNPLFTGADVVGPTNLSNNERYSIYYFGHGAGNPVLSFTANSSTQTLTFSGSGMQEVTDESWSLDNVVVTGINAPTAAPEPGTLALLFGALLPIGAVAQRRRRRALAATTGIVGATAALGMLSAPAAHAQTTITSLYNTGVDNTNTLLPLASVDSHYTMVSNNFSSASTLTFVNSSQLVGTWAQNATSQYISPDTSDGSSINGGVYAVTYRTTFTLPANANLSSVAIAGIWSTDNQGTNILINGVSTSITSSGFSGFTSFNLPTGSFQTGTNTLDFVWNNQGGPGGLNVAFTTKTFSTIAPSAAPEPGTLALLAGATLPALGVLVRRRASRRGA